MSSGSITNSSANGAKSLPRSNCFASSDRPWSCSMSITLDASRTFSAPGTQSRFTPCDFDLFSPISTSFTICAGSMFVYVPSIPAP